MVFERQLTVGCLDVAIAGVLAHTQNFVIISLRHDLPSAYGFTATRTIAGLNNLPLNCSSLKLAQNRMILGFVRLHSLHRLMQVGIEWLAAGLNRFQAQFLERFEQVADRSAHAFGIITIGSLHFECALEIIQYRQDVPHQIHGGELQEIGPLPFAAAAGIVDSARARNKRSAKSAFSRA